MDFDLIVIGSGPGGYHAAIRAGQLGLKTAIVEKGEIGGVCLNVGCIPSEVLRHVATEFTSTSAMKYQVVVCGIPDVILEKLEVWKQCVVSRVTGGVAQLLKANTVELIEVEATCESAEWI